MRTRGSVVFFAGSGHLWLGEVLGRESKLGRGWATSQTMKDGQYQLRYSHFALDGVNSFN